MQAGGAGIRPSCPRWTTTAATCPMSRPTPWIRSRTRSMRTAWRVATRSTADSPTSVTSPSSSRSWFSRARATSARPTPSAGGDHGGSAGHRPPGDRAGWRSEGPRGHRGWRSGRHRHREPSELRARVARAVAGHHHDGRQGQAGLPQRRVRPGEGRPGVVRDPARVRRNRQGHRGSQGGDDVLRARRHAHPRGRREAGSGRHRSGRVRLLATLANNAAAIRSVTVA